MAQMACFSSEFTVERYKSPTITLGIVIEKLVLGLILHERVKTVVKHTSPAAMVSTCGWSPPNSPCPVHGDTPRFQQTLGGQASIHDHVSGREGSPWAVAAGVGRAAGEGANPGGGPNPGGGGRQATLRGRPRRLFSVGGGSGARGGGGGG